MDRKSRIGWPKVRMAGDSLVPLSGVFQYCSIARWKASMLMVQKRPVLSISRRLTVFMFLLCNCYVGSATKDRLWWTSHSAKNCQVMITVNFGPPLEASSTAVPYVTKVHLRQKNESLSLVRWSFNNWSVRIMVHNNEAFEPLICEEICT